jgi:peptidoglycan/xylan/chitin deacetylase (PgdA/CDA1 family)
MSHAERGPAGQGMPSILTFDLHRSDDPDHIRQCIDVLDQEGASATFFVPTAMQAMPQFREALRALSRSRHEIGTHGHQHDWDEIAALQTGAGPLGFLERSAAVASDFFGSPISLFRSPCWCWLCQKAEDELAEIGYVVDSSRTPQRPGLLSSFPWDNRNAFRRRLPHLLSSGVLEVPTTTLPVPLASQSLKILRPRVFSMFHRLLQLEGSVRPPGRCCADPELAHTISTVGTITC